MSKQNKNVLRSCRERPSGCRGICCPLGAGAVGRETSWERTTVCTRARLALELQVSAEYYRLSSLS